MQALLTCARASGEEAEHCQNRLCYRFSKRAIFAFFLIILKFRKCCFLSLNANDCISSRGVGLDDVWSSLPTPTILRFCEYSENSCISPRFFNLGQLLAFFPTPQFLPLQDLVHRDPEIPGGCNNMESCRRCNAALTCCGRKLFAPSTVADLPSHSWDGTEEAQQLSPSGYPDSCYLKTRTALGIHHHVNLRRGKILVLSLKSVMHSLSLITSA
ncbi:transmembrane protein 233 isoform X2 [Numida meleagris]|uniref:transmembrane protein 233 isoform X2 n=1 Tax=Numida meleagris TaxID=8996 RepID=UPI000B3E21EA|nr:transmembrane protein 233 isoform X2 [Numida meleagris]